MSKINKEEILNKCNEASENTLIKHLDIEYIDIGENFMTAKMPVTSKVHQYDGVLHGGVSAALAETIGSMAAHILYCNNETQFVRGIEISANHVRAVASGYVYAKAVCLHPGRTLQVWDIKITDDDNRLISICKHTTIILDKKK